MTLPTTNTLESLPRAFPFVEGRDYRVDDAGCWVWLGWIDGQGYGRCQIEALKRATGTARAHRVGWLVLHGQRLSRRDELHHVCRNTACVNPAHLEVLDASEHRRQHKHGDSHLTHGDIIAMREAAWTGEEYEDIAPRYGIHPNQVSRICRGTQWANVGGPTGTPPLRCRHCNAELDVKLRTKRYCNTTCQSAWFREQERQSAAAQCAECHRAATAIYRGEHFCGYHCKRYWDDPELVRLGSTYAAGRTREARRIAA